MAHQVRGQPRRLLRSAAWLLTVCPLVGRAAVLRAGLSGSLRRGARSSASVEAHTPWGPHVVGEAPDGPPAYDPWLDPPTEQPPGGLPARAPSLHSEFEAPDWEQRLKEGWTWRKRLLSDSETYAGALNTLVKPDCNGNSSNLTNASTDALQDESFWTEYCEGFGPKQARPLDGWELRINTTCAEEDRLGDEEFADEAEAKAHCGALCAAVVDVGCQRENFTLCRMGAWHSASTNGSCLRLRFPLHPPPEGEPRAPRPWADFCDPVRFRPLFPGRLCTDAATITLPGAASAPACAVQALGNETCSDTFDFEEDTGSCRCLVKEQECKPEVLESAKRTPRDSIATGVFLIAPNQTLPVSFLPNASTGDAAQQSEGLETTDDETLDDDSEIGIGGGQSGSSRAEVIDDPPIDGRRRSVMNAAEAADWGTWRVPRHLKFTRRDDYA